MRVIAVLNQKGGVGKTTIAVHLARALQLMGHETLLVDSDPQGSARDWAAAKSEQPLTVIGLDRPTLDRDVKRLGCGGYVVIDGAPQLKDMAASAIKAADLALIPVQPSPYDIWATADLVDLVKQRIEITDGRFRAVFVVSRVITGTKIGKEVFDVLAGYGLPILKSAVSQRVIFAVSAASGDTAMDMEQAGAAAQEVKALAGEVLGILDVEAGK
jgi:chromosome partitioning protein